VAWFAAAVATAGAELATGTDAGSAAGAVAGAAAGTAYEECAPDLLFIYCRNDLSGNRSTSASAATCSLVEASFLVLAIAGAVGECKSTIYMPNELKVCSEISTPNLLHPADHYAPLRTGPSLVDLEG
jgi:hypothetical protein